MLNKLTPGKLPKQEFDPAINIYRSDRADVTADDRATIAEAITTLQVTNMLDASLVEISTGKSRMAGECLQMEVDPGCLTIVSELINSLPAFFAVTPGEPLRILSLWCSLPAVFKGILDAAILPLALAAASKGALHQSAFNITRKYVVATPPQKGLYVWIQVSPETLAFLSSCNNKLYINGLPVTFKLQRPSYVPSRGDIARLSAAPEKPSTSGYTEPTPQEETDLLMEDSEDIQNDLPLSNLSLKSPVEKNSAI